MTQGTITVNREPQGYVDRLRAYGIWIDGNLAGKIRRGESQRIQVAAGEHEVCLKIDWCRSPSVRVTLGVGESVELTAAPNAHPLTVLYYITLGRKQYIRLAPIVSFHRQAQELAMKNKR
jgi:hypothetical protein